MDARVASTTRSVAVGALASALALTAVLMRWTGSDLAVHVFLAQMVRAHGFVLWNAQWYGGEPVLSYSVLSPLAGAVLGPFAVGVASWIVAAVIFDRVV